MRLVPLALICSLAACSGGPKQVSQPAPPPDPIRATAGPDCKTVADHLLTITDHDAMQADQESKIVSTYRARCEKDHWTDESRNCMAAAQNDDEATGCNKTFTPGQIQHLGDDKAMLAGGNKAAEPVEDAAVGGGESKPHSTTRGAVKKQNKPKPKTSDPCEGGQ